jgi:thiosulfate dehydrogenase [quinone] large subunit
LRSDQDARPAPWRAITAARNSASILALRAFLGATFIVAGVQKLANPGFLQSGTPGSFEEQVRASIMTSPLHHVLDPILHAPILVALVIATGELAVGVGTLFGMLGRVAALGGMLLSFSFFLTVSFNDSPYYYGADIVFLFAWTPFVIGGAGPYSLDELLARRVVEDREQARALASRNSSTARRRAAELERRVVLQRLGGMASLAALTAVTGVLASALGRLLSAPGTPPTGLPVAGGSVDPAGSGGPAAHGGAATSTTGNSATTAVKGVRVLSASAIPLGGAAFFTDPVDQAPAYAVQPTKGSYRAFSAICTHAGCTVQFDEASESFVCPCHGSVFSARAGTVIGGPAPSALLPIPLVLGPGGGLYAGG